MGRDSVGRYRDWETGGLSWLGNIVAKGLLTSGKLSEYLGLRGSLYATGQAVGMVAQTTGDSVYTITLNGTKVTAADIIKEIRKFEKQTGKKYFAN